MALSLSQFIKYYNSRCLVCEEYDSNWTKKIAVGISEPQGTKISIAILIKKLKFADSSEQMNFFSLSFYYIIEES